MKSKLILILVLCVSMLSMAQSEKKVLKKGITKRVVTEISYEDGLKNEAIEEEKWFDDLGNVIELKEYNNEGKLKLWVKYTYVDEDEIESETYFSAKGKVTEKIVYKYKDGLKEEKLYYDGKDRLVKKKNYVYSSK